MAEPLSAVAAMRRAVLACIRRAFSAVVWFAVLALAAVGLLLAGIFMLCGLAWTLIAGGIMALGLAALLLLGMNRAA